MKLSLLKLSLILLLMNWFGVGKAQFMSKSEASKIEDLLKEVSKQHKPAIYIFKNVSVLTMLDAQMEEKDVLIENGVIKEIGDDINDLSAFIIDGRGKYLIPGLTDMHVHLFDHHQMKNTWMLLLLLNGVTSVRDMAGEPGKLELRDIIKNDEILGPNLYQSGPIINGSGGQPAMVVASTPDEGRKHVQEQKQSGYDFIKVYDDLSRETYFAIVEEANQNGISVVGHIPLSIRIKEALNKQSSIEHLTGYKRWKNDYEAHLIAEADFAASTGQSTSWNCPTLYNLIINWDKQMAESLLDNQNITALLPNKLVRRWEGMMLKNTQKKEELLAKYGEGNKELFKQIVLDLYKADAKLIAGTDAGSIPLLIPGFSLHEELRALNAIGIPNFDVLKMATVNAALAMGEEDEFGTIEVGKRADLILLDSNPLLNIDHMQDPDGIMVRGIWLSNTELERIRREIRTAFDNQR